MQALEAIRRAPRLRDPMTMSTLAIRSAVLAVACLPALAQDKTKPAPKPPVVATWMDLSPGTDVSYSVDDDNKLASGGSAITASGGSGRHAVRIVSLGADAVGALRIAIIDEQLPSASFETAIVRAEIVTLDPATGALRRSDAANGPFKWWSPAAVFPYPALSTAEWKAKKPVVRTMWTAVAGEACELLMGVQFDNRKEGKKQVPVMVAKFDGRKPAAVRLVGIAGIVALEQGQLVPKLGESGVEPVDAKVVELYREYTIDATKGRVIAVYTTGKVTAGDGKIAIACRGMQNETERRLIAAKDLPAAVEVVEAICAIVRDVATAREERKAKVEALKDKAMKAGFGPTVDRLLDSLTRDGLPPVKPR